MMILGCASTSCVPTLLEWRVSSKPRMVVEGFPDDGFPEARCKGMVIESVQRMAGIPGKGLALMNQPVAMVSSRWLFVSHIFFHIFFSHPYVGK